MQPDVWVSRLVIFSKLTPKEQTIIRDIPLSQGMNIICAKAVDVHSGSVDIAGHSAGKTTFCRFIRYVLGEKTFSNKFTMAAIRQEFPLGYVAAEIFVRGQKWAVRRPIGDGRASYVLPDATIEELLAANAESVSQEAYTERLGLDAILDSMETSQVVQTSEQILWAHILAWCSRDQESRFQTLYGWRNSQSDSGTPSFQSRRTGPLSVIRVILGLYLPEELKDEEILAGKKRHKEQLEKQLEKDAEEPRFRIALYERHLKDFLVNVFPEIADIDARPYNGQNGLFAANLVGLAAQAQTEINSQITSAENEQNEAEEEMGAIQARIGELDTQRNLIEALYGLEKAGEKEVDPELSKRQQLRKRYNENKDSWCLYGLLQIKDCPVFKEQQQIVQLAEVQDAHLMEQAEAKRIEAMQKVNEELDRIDEQLRMLSGDLLAERQARKKAQDKLYAAQRKKDELTRILCEHERWSNWHDKPDEYRMLHKTRSSLDELNREIAVIEDTLSELLKVHNSNRDILSTIFRNVVRSVLPDTRLNGEVRLDGGEIAFDINREGKVGGEAISTLSVLLADMSALVFTIVSEQSRLPGFLMHDSPREADMDYSLYHSYIRSWGKLQREFSDKASCPFQYIITTTSEPPEEYRTPQYLKLELDASTSEGLLLKCSIDNKSTDIFAQ